MLGRECEHFHCRKCSEGCVHTLRQCKMLAFAPSTFPRVSDAYVNAYLYFGLCTRTRTPPKYLHTYSFYLHLREKTICEKVNINSKQSHVEKLNHHRGRMREPKTRQEGEWGPCVPSPLLPLVARIMSHSSSPCVCVCALLSCPPRQPFFCPSIAPLEPNDKHGLSVGCGWLLAAALVQFVFRKFESLPPRSWLPK